MITLALALADRFNQIRKEKAADQLKLLHSEQKLVKTLQNKEEELQNRVHERTQELQSANQEILQAYNTVKLERAQAVEARQQALADMKQWNEDNKKPPKLLQTSKPRKLNWLQPKKWHRSDFW